MSIRTYVCMCMGVLGMLVNHKRRRCDVSHESYSGWYLIEKEGSLALVLPYPPIRQQIRYVCEMLLRVYGGMAAIRCRVFFADFVLGCVLNTFLLGRFGSSFVRLSVCRSANFALLVECLRFLQNGHVRLYDDTSHLAYFPHSFRCRRCIFTLTKCWCGVWGFLVL